MTRFCIICGKKNVPLINNMCLECYKKNYSLIEVPKEVSIEICPQCLSYKFKDRWFRASSPDPVEAVSEASMRSISAKMKIKAKKIVNIDSRIVSGIRRISMLKSGRITMEVLIKGAPLENVEPYEEAHEVTVHVLWRLCPLCFKVRAKSKEATLQIRAEGRHLTPEEVKQILGYIDNVLLKLHADRREAVVVDYEFVGGGIDIHFASKKVARMVAQFLQRDFLASVKESYEVIGMKKGTLRTREKISVRLPSYKVGDVVEVRNRYVLVTMIGGGRLHGIDLSSYDSVVIGSKDLKNVKNVSYERVKAMVISISGHIVQVMNLSNYEIVELNLRRVPSWIKQGAEVNLIKINNEFFIAPLTRSQI